jgi:hypothetical protein
MTAGWWRRDLGEREAGLMPDRRSFGPVAEYLEAWHLWRAIRRDARMNDDERDASFEMVIENAKRIMAERERRR